MAVEEGSTCLLLAPSLGAIVTTRGNIGKSIWLPLPSSLSRAALAAGVVSRSRPIFSLLSRYHGITSPPPPPPGSLASPISVFPILSFSLAPFLSLYLSLALDADG